MIVSHKEAVMLLGLCSARVKTTRNYQAIFFRGGSLVSVYFILTGRRLLKKVYIETRFLVHIWLRTIKDNLYTLSLNMINNYHHAKR